LPLKSGTIAVIGPLADAKKYGWNLVSLQTWINPFLLIAGIKEVAEVGLMCFTPSSNLDYDASFEEKATMFGKTLHRDDELLQN
jgi:beta-glucosidase